jgi:hypothetical protein
MFPIGKFLTWLHYTARTLGGLSRKQLRIGYPEPRQMPAEAASQGVCRRSGWKPRPLVWDNPTFSRKTAISTPLMYGSLETFPNAYFLPFHSGRMRVRNVLMSLCLFGKEKEGGRRNKMFDWTKSLSPNLGQKAWIVRTMITYVHMGTWV